jgi:hypothetical protein
MYVYLSYLNLTTMIFLGDKKREFAREKSSLLAEKYISDCMR